MAEVFDTVNGEQIQRLIARTRPVQNALDLKAFKVLGRAIGVLEAHRQEGNAQLGIDHGMIDRYVYLEDPPAASSPGAAASIEFGHYAGKRQKGKKGRKRARRKWVEGIWPLHTGASLPKKPRHKP